MGFEEFYQGMKGLVDRYRNPQFVALPGDESVQGIDLGSSMVAQVLRG